MPKSMFFTFLEMRNHFFSNAMFFRFYERRSYLFVVCANFLHKLKILFKK